MYIVLDVNKISKNDLNFVIKNLILAKTTIFSKEDILNELKEKGLNDTRLFYIVDNCLEDFLDNGFTYEIGNYYQNRDRERKWRCM